MSIPFFSKVPVRAALIALLSLFILGGCGYIGPIVPPSPETPNPVPDVNVIERGDRLEITFTVPAKTTDNLKIFKLSEIELRIGPEPHPFELESWASGARAYELPLPPPKAEDDTKPVAMSYELPAADWTGRRIAVAVRSAVKNKKNYSSWSNVVHMNVLPPLQTPKLAVEATAPGYKLSWADAGPGVKYRVFRQSPADKAPVQIGLTEKAEYVDQTSQWDTLYTYSVVAVDGPVESPLSDKISITHADTFAPSIPAEVAALAAADSIEISWQRSPEADLKGYFVYRSVNGEAFERQGDLITLPTYSDRKVEHGKTYRYEISAVDQKNNESAKSGGAEAVFP